MRARVEAMVTAVGAVCFARDDWISACGLALAQKSLGTQERAPDAAPETS